MSLLKGVETETFTGNDEGRAFGLSPLIAERFDDFDVEPDSRNVEHVSGTHDGYSDLAADLHDGRTRLRRWLRGIGGATIVPGGVLPLDGEPRFLRSDRDNEYHSLIEREYGRRVVTASLHINLGIEDTVDLFRVQRVLRMEAPLLLALSAASPFTKGDATGWHSTRWREFPGTPEDPPIFRCHEHFDEWMNEKLDEGEMVNERHLWLAVRPNGPDRPQRLNRVEVRIADVECSIDRIIAFVAWCEACALEALADPNFDPLARGYDPSELAEASRANEDSAARRSLAGEFWDWRVGRGRTVRAALEARRATPAYDRREIEPIDRILERGNRAMEWLRRYDELGDCAAVMREVIRSAAEEDRAFCAGSLAGSPSQGKAP